NSSHAARAGEGRRMIEQAWEGGVVAEGGGGRLRLLVPRAPVLAGRRVRAPRGPPTAPLPRLAAPLARTSATRIVFLGDFLHAREGREPETTRVVGEWRSRNAAIEMLLVRGNHDVRAGDPGPEIDVTCVDGPVVD